MLLTSLLCSEVGRRSIILVYLFSVGVELLAISSLAGMCSRLGSTPSFDLLAMMSGAYLEQRC